MSRNEVPALLERFRGYLRDHGLPVTRQRDLIAETLFAASDHPSAESLQRALRAAGARIGTATVYRTLELMVGAGEQHEHLVCRRCGRVVEFANERLERMLPALADEYGFQHQQHRVEIYGICQDCRRRDVAGLTAE